jgi:hypothetical protein
VSTLEAYQQIRRKKGEPSHVKLPACAEHPHVSGGEAVMKASHRLRSFFLSLSILGNDSVLYHSRPG